MYKDYLGCKAQTLLQVIFRVNLVLVVFALSNPSTTTALKTTMKLKDAYSLERRLSPT